MKLRTTTPVSLSRSLKWGIALAVIIVVAVSALYIARPTSADQYDDRIRELQADMSRYQAEANRLNAQAATLANALAQITNEKNALQSQIDLSQSQYDKLVIEIANTEKQIKDNQDGLGSTIADLYVDAEVSPIEMLASSENITDFLNKQEYRNTVRDQLSATIKRVKELKAEPSKKKIEVEKVLAEQKAARDDLAAKESEQANLLANTQNSEAKYQGMIRDSAKQIAAAKAAQAALAARANSSGGYTLVNSGSLGAYTSLWAPNDCWMGGPGGWYSYGGADGNGGDGRGYGCRQCASYAAWKVATVTGKYYNWGNGGDFAGNAVSAGYQNLGSSPQPGSIAVMWGNPGHVAWVEGVSGNQILVSQYNWQINGQYGMYSEMWLDKSVFDQYVKII
jgi:surface antigen/CII-binding regulator of phage lambda lysogenization HflD